MTLANVTFAAVIAACLVSPSAAEGYRGPAALALAADGCTLYVAAADATELTWVELPSGRIARRQTLPARPEALALLPAGDRLAVVCSAPQSTLVLLDAASGRRLAAIGVGHSAGAVAVAPDGRRAYVANRFDNDISIVDLVQAKELGRVAAQREPVALALSADGRTCVAANLLPASRTDAEYKGDVAAALTIFDTGSLQTETLLLPHGSTGVRGLCLLPDGRHLLAMHLLANFEQTPLRVDGGWINVNVVSVVDLARRKVLRTLGLDVYDAAAGNPWSVACTADGQTVCATLAGTHELAVVDAAELLDPEAGALAPMMGVWPIYPGLGSSPWRRIALGAKGPRALAIRGQTAYAACYFGDAVAVADLTPNPRPVKTIAVGPTPAPTTVRRGELLFHDATICYQHWQSCASCHPDGRVDGLNWDLLNDGEGNTKNTKSMLLAHRTPPAMAQGVRMSAEEAVRSGITSILFGAEPEEHAAAIDAYLKSLRPVPSPRLVDGGLSAAAARGKRLFAAEAGCAACHPAPYFTDRRSHPIVSVAGRHGKAVKLDTPTLVECWRTAPYMHDGRYLTVEELLIEGRHGLAGRGLSAAEIRDLVEYVLSL